MISKSQQFHFMNTSLKKAKMQTSQHEWMSEFYPHIMKTFHPKVNLKSSLSVRPTWRFSSLQWRVQQPTGSWNTDSRRRRTAHQSWTHNPTINNLTSQIPLYHLSFKCDKDKSTTVNTCSEFHSNHSGHWRKGLRQPERGGLSLLPKQIFFKKTLITTYHSYQCKFIIPWVWGREVVYFPNPLKWSDDAVSVIDTRCCSC